MVLDDGEFLIDEKEIEHMRWNERRVLHIVSYAKRECPDGICPIELEDFFDLYNNAGGYITQMNEPYCKWYYRNQMECMGLSFSCVSEDEIGILEL